ncbi:lysophospholipid acyltransferase family protein [Actinomycetota bacterium]|jgi:1-acyl-sn-glycerol-3-phosphate acyltransferase
MLENFIAAARTFVLVPLLFLYTMVLAIAVIIVVAIDPKTKAQDRIVEHWANLFLAIPPVRVTVEGSDNVDPGQRYVVASNHLSMFDIPLLFRVLPIHGRFLSKKEVFRYPVIGQGMRAIGIIEIDRDSSGSSRAAISAGVEIAAERGYSLLVFPEGTRSRDGELLPFKRGAFRIAIDTGLPLLPVVIEGTDRISPPGSKVFRAGSVAVRILPPIVTNDMTNKDDLRSFADAVEAEMGTVYEAMHRARYA